MFVYISPWFFVIEFARPFRYFMGLNWAWFWNWTAPAISKGKPVLVTKFAGKPKELRISTSFFICDTSDGFVVNTKLDCLSKSQFIFSLFIIFFMFSIASWFADK